MPGYATSASEKVFMININLLIVLYTIDLTDIFKNNSTLPLFMGRGEFNRDLYERTWGINGPDQPSRRVSGLSFWDGLSSSRKSSTLHSEFKPHDPVAIVPTAREGLTEMIFEAEKGRYTTKENGKPVIYATVGITKNLKQMANLPRN